MKLPLVLLALSLTFILAGCLQQVERPPIVTKPTEEPVITPTPPITEKPTETIKPEEPVEIKLAFPNGTAEKNGTYFLGEFTENFTFKVEPEDVKVYFNESSINVVNGTFTISVERGGNYTLRVTKEKLEKAYNVSIGHGEIIAEWMELDYGRKYEDKRYALLFCDLYRGPTGKFKVRYEDGTPLRNRTFVAASAYGLAYSINDVVKKEEIGSRKMISDLTTNLEGIAYFEGGGCGSAAGKYPFMIIDYETKKVVLKYDEEFIGVAEE